MNDPIVFNSAQLKSARYCEEMAQPPNLPTKVVGMDPILYSAIRVIPKQNNQVNKIPSATQIKITVVQQALTPENGTHHKKESGRIQNLQLFSTHNRETTFSKNDQSSNEYS